MIYRQYFLVLASAAFAACLFACSSDSTSANDNANNFAESSATITSGSIAKDSVYIHDTDTIYVSVKDTNNIPVTTPNTKNSSANSTASSSSQPSAIEAINSSSSDTALESSATTPASATTPENNTIPNSENLLWNDEFDGTAIDETKWGYNIGTGDNGWGNSEREYYTNRPENVYVKDGLLHIRAVKEDYEGSKYTSTRLLSQNKFTFTYGTVEARIALPAGKGIWPAFWMLGENIEDVSWPACGEIDIIEAINDESIVYGTHHWSHEGSHAQYGNNTSDYYGTKKDLDIREFHTYKMTWDKEFITMYVDDFKYQEIDIKDASGDMGTFHKPFFFILNVAVGGSWPGFDIDDSQFPTEMQVDYIRVYK